MYLAEHFFIIFSVIQLKSFAGNMKKVFGSFPQIDLIYVFTIIFSAVEIKFPRVCFNQKQYICFRCAMNESGLVEVRVVVEI